jgi:tripartite-type tricarboxylate transporter receptor subunit TctC
MTRMRAALAAAGAALALCAGQAAGQAWPAKPVRIIVPFPAGGATDLLARSLAQKLGESLGQTFFVDNRAGANGNIGAAAVAKSPPDGYTIMFCTTGPLVFNKIIYKTTPFDPLRDFAPIVLVADVPLLVAAHPSFPVRTLPELVAYAKANPGKVTYSSPGNGSMAHLSAEMIQKEAGIRLTHVPYKGTAPALTDFVAGVVNISFDLAPTYVPLVKAGKINPLAVTTATRSAALPDVPTVIESGVAGYQSFGWFAFVAPAGTPAEVIEKVNAVANQYIASPEGKARLAEFGMGPRGGTPQELGAFMASELTRWRPIAEPVAALLE